MPSHRRASFLRGGKKTDYDVSSFYSNHGLMSLLENVRSFRKHVKQWPRPLRVSAGIAFVFLGFLGFLPILGFWMLPVGVTILAIDIPVVKKFLHHTITTFNHWRRNRRQK